MILRRWRRALLIGLITFGVIQATAILLRFPWSVEDQADPSVARAKKYYQSAYEAGDRSKGAAAIDSAVEPLSAKEEFYVNFARTAALQERIPEKVRAAAVKFGLTNKKVLEVGAGSGLLQDVVADYTALDISPTARRFFHKPFVEASATDMPFPENAFDGIWSIWVLEHIPNAEKALMEMRRVVKPGGYLLLQPAFDVSRYAAQGYATRPYSDFDWKGKLIKASSVVAESKAFHYLQYHQIQLLRAIGGRLGSGPSRLHFVRLNANYDQFWQADSDATTSFSHYELYLWFVTRGDRCVNCQPERTLLLRDAAHDSLMVFQVNKP